MTQEIIEMARKAGLYQDINVSFHQALRNFYDLATAKEREACVNICYGWNNTTSTYIIEEIRARGEA
jgi:hypothetical protein